MTKVPTTYRQYEALRLQAETLHAALSLAETTPLKTGPDSEKRKAKVNAMRVEVRQIEEAMRRYDDERRSRKRRASDRTV
jgi:hypothetical protein